MFVSKKSTDNRRSVISSHTDKHESDLSYLSFSPEFIFLGNYISIVDILTILINLHISMVVLSLDKLI